MALSVSFPISLGVILLNDVNSFPLGDFKSIIPIMSAIHNMYHEWDRSHHSPLTGFSLPS